jgi:phosphatidate phosphatase APP1
VRNTRLVAEEDRLPIRGAAALYRALVDGDADRAPVFYVSTGAWNLHEPMEHFLARNGFPPGPLVMTDWGPGVGWLFREGSVEFKSRIVLELLAEHPHVRGLAEEMASLGVPMLLVRDSDTALVHARSIGLVAV